MESDEEITPLKRRRKINKDRNTDTPRSKNTPKQQIGIKSATMNSKTNSDVEVTTSKSGKIVDLTKEWSGSPKKPSSSKDASSSVSPMKGKTLSSEDDKLSFKGIFSSANNKADMVFFKPRSMEDSNKDKLIYCPICNINLVFLHGQSPQAHINHCLDRTPEFEKGYCSGDSSCSLSNIKHFRQFKHGHKSEKRKQAINNGTDSECSIYSSQELDCEDVTGVPDGASNGVSDCASDGVSDGASNGVFDGASNGVSDGASNGVPDGALNGVSNGASNGVSDGACSAASNSVFGVASNDVIEPSMLKTRKCTPAKQTSINDFFGGKKPPKTPVSVIQYRQNSKTEEKDKVKKKRQPNARKECPFYKKIPGTNFTVDAFRYGDIPGCTCYFLTHFHSDHYGGLTKSFNNKIYCSKITASLIQCQIKVSSEYIHVLPMNQTTCVEGAKITLLDANHCPGAVMFLMELPSGKRILHVGDFRADLSMMSHPAIDCKPIDTLYLDTTYCDPKYTFPAQSEVIDFVVRTSRAFLKENPRTLIVCGSYSVGKEKVFKAIAVDRNLKIAVTKAKMSLLKCIDDDELNQRLVLDDNQAGLHVLSMNKLSIKALQEHLAKYRTVNKWERVLAFKPTGWTFSDRLTSLKDIVPIRRPDVTIYGVPYSEHSSFAELESFVSALKPKHVIPTVNIGRQESRDQMNEYFADWLK